MKKCIDCRKEKEDWEFEGSIDNRNGRPTIRPRCYACECERKRIRDHNRQYRPHLYRYYGITEVDYELMLKSQNGKCDICGRPEIVKRKNDKIDYLSVDHDHETGRVRGLLCSNCNRGIGLLKDNPELLREAIKYLEK